MFVSVNGNCNVKGNGNGKGSGRLRRLGHLLSAGLGDEMMRLLPAEFVSALTMPGHLLQHSPKSLQALAGHQSEGIHFCFCLCRPEMQEPATRLECRAGETGWVWMADGSGDLDFPLDGQRLTTSRVNDLIILYQPQEIELSVHRCSPVLRRGYSTASDAATVTTGDNEFGSPCRRTFWFLREIAPGTAQHCIAVTLRFRGELDVPAMEQAVGALLSRRGISCANPAASGELPCQRINGTMTVFVEEHDVDDIDDARLAEQLECSVNDPLDLPCGSPLQVRLYHRISGETVILVVAHQSVADFWSITACIRELETLYSELTGGASALLPELAAFTRYYSWVDGSRVSTRAALGPDESSDVSAVP